MAVLMSDDGTGKSDGVALDTAKWVTEGSTAGGGDATYQSSALRFQSGNQGGYAGTSRTSRSVNITAPTDVDISGTFLIGSTVEPYALIMARATTSGVDFPNGYYLSLTKSWAIRIGKTVNYSGTDLATGSLTPASGTTYSFRFQVIGSTVRARVWTGSEPSTWDVSVTDTTFTGSGKVGITIGAGNAATTHPVTFDNIVVTDGANDTNVSGSDDASWTDNDGSVAVTVSGTTDNLAWTDNDGSVSVDPGSGSDNITWSENAFIDQVSSTANDDMVLSEDASVDATLTAATDDMAWAEDAFITIEASDADNMVWTDNASLAVYPYRHELTFEAEFEPGVWTDLSDRIDGTTEAQGTFGRPTRFDDTAASTFRVTLWNTDGALTIGNPNSPYYPNVEKGFAVRASIIWAGQEYPIFRGQAIDIDMPAIISADSAKVTIACADLMAALERKVLGSPWVEEARRVARYEVNGGWCDVFPFPASSVKTEASVQVADTSFDNKGIEGPGSADSRPLGTCRIIPAGNGGGSVRSSGTDGNGGALTEGTLDFEIGDNGSGRQTHPFLQFRPQVGFQQFELLFKVPTGVLPPIYATGTRTISSGENWNTIRDQYGLTYDELRLLNPQLAGLEALSVGQVININNDGKAGSEWVLAQFWAPGNTEVLRICLVNNAGKMSLISRNPSTGGAAYIWSGATLNDGRWRKLTIYKSATNQVRANINDSSTGQTISSLPGDLASVVTTYVGGRILTSGQTSGQQTQCPEFSVGGVAFHKQSGVWSYFVLGAPPANITARQRLIQLAQYAHPVLVQVDTRYNSSIADPFTTNVVRTDISGRSVLDCMQELARTVGGYLWVEPGTGILTMRKGPVEPLSYLPIDLVADADDTNPPRWRNTVDNEPTRVVAKCPAGEATSINSTAESRSLYRSVDVETCAATVAVAKSVGDRYVGGSGTLHLTNLQVDLVHAEHDLWGAFLNNFLPTERGIKVSNTVPEVTGFDNIDAVVESWTLTSTIESMAIALETTPIRAYSNPALPSFAVTSATGDQSDGTITVPRPSGTATGDYLVAIATTDETGTLDGLQAGGTGWTIQGAGQDSDAGAGKVWTRVATASEPNAYTFTVDGSNGSQALMSDTFPGANGSAVDTAKWTLAEVRTGASFTNQDGYGLMNPGTGTGYSGRIGAWVNTPDRADVDMTWSFYLGDGDSFHWVGVRAQTNAGQEFVSGIQISPSFTSNAVKVEEVTNFSTVATVCQAPLTISAGTWIRVRVRVEGGQVQVKAWPAASAEPGSWGGTGTAATYLSAGKIGFVCGGGNAATSRVRLDDVSINSTTTVQAGWPETHATVIRVSGVDTDAPITAAPVWGADAAATTSHVAPSATLSDDGLRISHWHLVTDGEPGTGGGDTGGGGGGTGASSGFSFGMSGFEALTETAGSAEISAANNWLTNKSLKAVGHWQDNSAAVQAEQWGIGSGERYGGWNGIIDIAVGAIFGSETWATAASGSLDSRWTTALNAIATKWGSRNKALLHIRFAHEFNGNFSPWAVTDSGNNSYTNFKTAWIRFANLVRSILPGAQIVWSPNDGTSSLTNVDNAYPGSAYVDVIGVDTYNAWPHVTNNAGWTSKINLVQGVNPTGIEAWRQYALAKGKPMALPEWGNPAVDDGSGGGGGDDPYWAEQTIAWCKANGGSGAGQVKYAVYFNIGVNGGYPPDYLIYAGASGQYGTVRQPNTATAIRNNA